MNDLTLTAVVFVTLVKTIISSVTFQVLSNAGEIVGTLETRSIHRLVLRSEKKYWKWLASWQYKANTEQIRRKLLTSFLIHCRSRQILSVASSGTWTRTFVTSDAVKHGRGNAYCTFDLSSMCDARSPFLHKSKNTLMPMPLPLIGIYTAHAGIEIFYWFYFVYNSLYIILKVIYLKISIHGGTAL